MIDISPKALRFARLAAEEQPAFSQAAEVALIKRDEEAFGRRDGGDRVGRHMQISERTAEFCMRAVTAFLDQPDRFRTAEWDGNDFAFLQAVARSLRDQLTPSNAQAL